MLRWTVFFVYFIYGHLLNCILYTHTYTHGGHESPHVAPCAVVLHFLCFSFSSLFIYAQITKPHSNHANMLMTFVSRIPIFSTPEITWVRTRWLHVLVCFVLWADFRIRFASHYSMVNGTAEQTCACMCLVGASMFLRVVPYLLWLHSSSFDFVRLFVCLFCTKARRHSIRKQFGNYTMYVCVLYPWRLFARRQSSIHVGENAKMAISFANIRLNSVSNSSIAA